MKRPRIIGITGGVGAGKTECLRYIEESVHCLVIYADPEAAKLRRRGEACYEPLVELLGSGVLDADGEIDSGRMAERIFADESLLAAVNGIIHPAVNDRIRAMIDRERRERNFDFVFVEAALLIENGYEAFVDEMWYIYADASVRRSRLKATRGYSDEKIDEIFAGQLSDEEFRAHCPVVIDNSGDMTETKKQIDLALRIG
ncbi:MAG: dephospho-CoA kinase [Lachnospiraceae bacterium]|nr:dephospho-CoA kinase [Lachnospiraceae bacterium]